MSFQRDSAEAVTPSDATTFAEASIIYVGVTGDVTVEPVGSGTNITFTGVPAGSILPVRVSMVYSTGTTATNITRMYKG